MAEQGGRNEWSYSGECCMAALPSLVTIGLHGNIFGGPAGVEIKCMQWHQGIMQRAYVGLWAVNPTIAARPLEPVFHNERIRFGIGSGNWFAGFTTTDPSECAICTGQQQAPTREQIWLSNAAAFQQFAQNMAQWEASMERERIYLHPDLSFATFCQKPLVTPFAAYFGSFAFGSLPPPPQNWTAAALHQRLETVMPQIPEALNRLPPALRANGASAIRPPQSVITATPTQWERQGETSAVQPPNEAPGGQEQHQTSQPPNTSWNGLPDLQLASERNYFDLEPDTSGPGHQMS